MHLLIDVEDVVLNITTHVPGLTEEGLSSISQLMLIELVVPDISAMHKNFAIWAMQYLPMEYVKSEDDLNLQLQLLLSLHESSYVAGLVSSTSDIEAILHGGKNPLPTVDDSIIRQIDFTLL